MREWEFPKKVAEGLGLLFREPGYHLQRCVCCFTGSFGREDRPLNDTLVIRVFIA